MSVGLLALSPVYPEASVFPEIPAASIRVGVGFMEPAIRRAAACRCQRFAARQAASPPWAGVEMRVSA